MLIASSNDVIHPVIPQIFIPFYVHLFLYFLGGGGGELGHFHKYKVDRKL